MSKIKKIEVIRSPDAMIDLSLKNDHTFWVSETGEEWYLTHNTSWPDVDCLSSSHLVLMSDGSKKRIDSLKPGDRVLDAAGCSREVLHVQNRQSDLKTDTIFHILCRKGDVYGYIVANHAHRLLSESGEQITVRDLTVGSLLDGGIVVSISSCKEIISLTDITVDSSSTFRVVPFDVLMINDQEGNETPCCIASYNIDSDIIEEIVNAFQKGQFREDCRRFKL